MEIVKYLMPKFGNSRFDLDNLAQSCLHKAVREGHPKMVRYLIEEGGFDPNLSDKVRRYMIAIVQALHNLMSLSICRMTSGLLSWSASCGSGAGEQA